MSPHALVSPGDIIDRTALQDAGRLPVIKRGWRWLPLVEDTKPEFDPATHKVVEGDLVVGSNRVLQTWDVVALNGYELYAAAVAAGYPVTPEGFNLRLGDTDRAAFAQMLSLVSLALELQLITDETPQTIADVSGAVHEVTTLRFRQIMVGYGFHYKSLWDALVTN